MGREDDEYLSTDEVRAKLSCLLEADLLRLRRMAELQAKKLRNCDPDDLLSDGLDRVVSGARRWPRVSKQRLYANGLRQHRII